MLRRATVACVGLLTSLEKAMLGAFVTAASAGAGDDSVAPEQIIQVAKGQGRFKLRFQVPRDGIACPIGGTCGPHVSIYPAAGGESYLSAYL